MWGTMIILVVSFFSLISIGDGHRTTPVMYMSDYCDLSIPMTGSMLLDLTAASQYDSNWECIVNVQTQEPFEDRLMFKFLWMDIESGPSCTFDRLIIYNGVDTLAPKLTGRYGLCGSITPTRIYKSSNAWLTLNFTSDDSQGGRGFQMLVTTFDDSGLCDNTEFLCDNGYCIDDYLKCDGYNNCGDGSDEDEGCTLSMTAIVGITIGSIAGLFVVAAVVIGLARTRRTVTTIQHAATERSYLTQPHDHHPRVFPCQPPSYAQSQNDIPPSYNATSQPPLTTSVPTISAQLTSPVENK